MTGRHRPRPVINLVSECPVYAQAEKFNTLPANVTTEPTGGEVSMGKKPQAGTSTGVWLVEGTVDELMRLNVEGLSAGSIAWALSRKFDRPFSRNAVIGKLARMGVRLAGATSSDNQSLPLSTTRPVRAYVPKTTGVRRYKKQTLSGATEEPKPKTERVIPTKIPDELPAGAFNVRMLDRGTRQCPTLADDKNDKGEFMVCGLPSGDKNLLCDWHYSLHYISPEARRNNRANATHAAT